MQFGRVVAMAASLLLVGCTPSAPPTTPAPAPTFICTPEAGGAQRTCSQQDFEKMKAKDAQYAEAEKVYREFMSEYERVMRLGGAKSLSPTLQSILIEKDLAAGVLGQFQDFKEQGLRLRGEGIRIASVERVPGKLIGNSTVTLRFCVDASSVGSYRGSKRVTEWGSSEETMYFSEKPVGRMVIVDSETKVVEKCG